jgi:hypothetical protein
LRALLSADGHWRPPTPLTSANAFSDHPWTAGHRRRMCVRVHALRGFKSHRYRSEQLRCPVGLNMAHPVSRVLQREDGELRSPGQGGRGHNGRILSPTQVTTSAQRIAGIRLTAAGDGGDWLLAPGWAGATGSRVGRGGCTGFSWLDGISRISRNSFRWRIGEAARADHGGVAGTGSEKSGESC